MNTKQQVLVVVIVTIFVTLPWLAGDALGLDETTPAVVGVQIVGGIVLLGLGASLLRNAVTT